MTLGVPPLSPSSDQSTEPRQQYNCIIMSSMAHQLGIAHELTPQNVGKTPPDRHSYKTIQINGVSLAYREAGPSDGEPIILMHGHMSDVRTYIGVQDILASNGYHVFNYSRRFAWPNAPIAESEQDNWDNHAKDMVALIEALNLGRRVSLCGNSSGGFISLLCARDRPDLVASLIIEESPVVSIFFPYGLPPTTYSILRFMFFYPFAFIPVMYYLIFVLARVDQVIKDGDEDGATMLFLYSILSSVYYGELSKERHRWTADNQDWMIAFIKRGPGLPKFSEEEAIATAEKVPTVCLIGEHTADLGAREATRRLGKIMPGAKTVWVKNASHLVHENNPKQVAQEIVDHVERSTKKIK